MKVAITVEAAQSKDSPAPTNHVLPGCCVYGNSSICDEPPSPSP
ncbi:MAG: hypothetical protein RLZZ244_123 [Verrucomicrobiota bacterium]